MPVSLSANSGSSSGDGDSDEETTTGATESTAGLATRFEAETLPDGLVDKSEPDGSAPEIITSHGTDGTNALRLHSRAGAATESRVATASAMSRPVELTASVKRIESSGPESNLWFVIRDGASRKTVLLVVSDYFDGSPLRYHYDIRADPVTEVALDSGLAAEGWTDVSLELGAEGVTATIGEASRTIPVPADVFGSQTYLAVSAFGWNNGDRVTAAVDSLEITPR